MANIKSSIKSIKVSGKKEKNNVVFTSRVKNSIKKLEKEVATKDKEKASNLLKDAQVNIDKAFSKGLMKKNARDRQKSRLTKKVKEMNK